MNKTEVNRLLPKAFEVLKKTGIANGQDEIVKTYRGYISTFGAAVSGGSLLAAIAFFSDKSKDDETECDRTKLMQSLYLLLDPDGKPLERVDQKTLFEYIKRKILMDQGIDVRREAVWKEKIIDAAIALKLAMNLYKLV